MRNDQKISSVGGMVRIPNKSFQSSAHKEKRYRGEKRNDLHPIYTQTNVNAVTDVNYISEGRKCLFGEGKDMEKRVWNATTNTGGGILFDEDKY